MPFAKLKKSLKKFRKVKISPSSAEETDSVKHSTQKNATERPLRVPVELFRSVPCRSYEGTCTGNAIDESVLCAPKEASITTTSVNLKRKVNSKGHGKISSLHHKSLSTSPESIKDISDNLSAPVILAEAAESHRVPCVQGLHSISNVTVNELVVGPPHVKVSSPVKDTTSSDVMDHKDSASRPSKFGSLLSRAYSSAKKFKKRVKKRVKKLFSCVSCSSDSSLDEHLYSAPMKAGSIQTPCTQKKIPKQPSCHAKVHPETIPEYEHTFTHQTKKEKLATEVKEESKQPMYEDISSHCPSTLISQQSCKSFEPDVKKLPAEESASASFTPETPIPRERKLQPMPIPGREERRREKRREEPAVMVPVEQCSPSTHLMSNELQTQPEGESTEIGKDPKQPRTTVQDFLSHHIPACDNQNINELADWIVKKVMSDEYVSEPFKLEVPIPEKTEPEENSPASAALDSQHISSECGDSINDSTISVVCATECFTQVAPIPSKREPQENISVSVPIIHEDKHSPSTSITPVTLHAKQDRAREVTDKPKQEINKTDIDDSEYFAEIKRQGIPEFVEACFQEADEQVYASEGFTAKASIKRKSHESAYVREELAREVGEELKRNTNVSELCSSYDVSALDRKSINEFVEATVRNAASEMSASERFSLVTPIPSKTELEENISKSIITPVDKPSPSTIVTALSFQAEQEKSTGTDEDAKEQTNETEEFYSPYLSASQNQYVHDIVDTAFKNVKARLCESEENQILVDPIPSKMELQENTSVSIVTPVNTPSPSTNVTPLSFQAEREKSTGTDEDTKDETNEIEHICSPYLSVSQNQYVRDFAKAAIKNAKVRLRELQANQIKSS